MSMKRPVCMVCQVTFRTEQIGLTAIEIDDENNPVGLWQVDELACPSCDKRILWGWGDKPWSKPTDKGFRENALRSDVRFRG